MPLRRQLAHSLALLAHLVESAQAAKQFCHELLVLHHYTHPGATMDQRQAQWRQLPVLHTMSNTDAAYVRQVMDEIFQVASWLPLDLVEFILELAVPTLIATGQRSLMDGKRGIGSSARAEEAVIVDGPARLATLVHRQIWQHDAPIRALRPRERLEVPLDAAKGGVAHLISPGLLAIHLAPYAWLGNMRLDWATWAPLKGKFDSIGVHAGDSICFILQPGGHELTGAITGRENHKTGRKPGVQHRAAITSLDMILQALLVKPPDPNQPPYWLPIGARIVPFLDQLLRDSTSFNHIWYTPGAAAPGIFRAIASLLPHHLRFIRGPPSTQSWASQDEATRASIPAVSTALPTEAALPLPGVAPGLGTHGPTCRPA